MSAQARPSSFSDLIGGAKVVLPSPPPIGPQEIPSRGSVTRVSDVPFALTRRASPLRLFIGQAQSHKRFAPGSSVRSIFFSADDRYGANRGVAGRIRPLFSRGVTRVLLPPLPGLACFVSAG